jgi:uncharacterized protein YutE (UPF0331/DUF86 family)
MSEVDVSRVRDLLGNLANALRLLRELAAIPEEEFLADFRNTESAKYLLVVATEACIDLCNHLVARGGGRAPRDYADCFAVLVELKVIRGELASRLQRVARFRNLLVHLYWEVDNRRVYQFLQADIDDLKVFGESLREWLKL